jgi:nucleoside-diphosphate-sugar epimerase
MRKIDVLFGGGGYLGYYLAKLLLDEDHDVFSVDRKHYNQVKGVFNLVGTGPIHEDLERLFELLDGTQEVTLYHLACP